MARSDRNGKGALRARLQANRAAPDAGLLAEAARRLHAVVLPAPEIAAATRVAAHVSVGREPGTGCRTGTLSNRGVEVLLPLLLPAGDLDGTPYTGPRSRASAARGLLVPTAEPRGVDAVTGVDVSLVPGLAADRHGTRLGRGGGSYDRVLARLAGRPLSCVLLHDGELLDVPIPREPHDVPVDVAATPRGLRRLRPGR